MFLIREAKVQMCVPGHKFLSQQIHPFMNSVCLSVSLEMGVSLHNFGLPGPYYAEQAGLQLLEIYTLCFKCWDQRCVPPCPTSLHGFLNLTADEGSRSLKGPPCSSCCLPRSFLAVVKWPAHLTTAADPGQETDTVRPESLPPKDA